MRRRRRWEVPGAGTWSRYLEPVPGAGTWSRYLEPVENARRPLVATVLPMPVHPESPPPKLSSSWERLRKDGTLRGRDWSKAAVGLADRWLEELFWSALAGEAPAKVSEAADVFGRWRARKTRQEPGPGLAGAGVEAGRGLALIAVGSLGRGDLAPGSDFDLLLVHSGQPDVKHIADRLWYPIWDDPMPLDHSVRTIPEVSQAAESDLRVALGLLDARLVAGDEELAARLVDLGRRLWEKRVARWLPEVLKARSAAQASLGEVAFVVEPNLQEARGGLRDVQVLDLLHRVSPVLPHEVAERLGAAADLLHSVRVEIQRPSGRRSEKLLIEDQDRVAGALGLADREVLAHNVADAGRTIAWLVEDASRRALSWLAGPRGRGGSADRPAGAGLVLRDGEVVVPLGTVIAGDPTLPLRAAAASAEFGVPLERQTMARLAAEPPTLKEPWPEDVLRSFLRLLSTGAAGIHAIETLDQLGVWERYLPEWAQARNRPQFDPFHRWTVDRHLLEAVARAADHLSDVRRPDLLLLGALLHDIGKGTGGDHSHAGAEIAKSAAVRFSLSPHDAAVLEKLVLHHLLLPDTATRRDVEDRATAEGVAAAAGDITTLELLAALAAADGLATGPSAWSDWKARLVDRLVARAGALLEGRPLPEGPAFPNEDQRRLLAEGALQVVPGERDMVVVAPDRPGLLSDVTGALALHGIGVLEARAHSEGGSALEVFKLDLLDGSAPRWERIVADVERAVLRRFNISEALARHEEAGATRRRRRSAALPVPGVRVSADNSGATDATVLEVRALDTPGHLHRVTAALAALDLDIVSARVSTLGAAAIDTFYVRSGGAKLTKAEAEAVKSSVEKALLGLPEAKPTGDGTRNTPET